MARRFRRIKRRGRVRFKRRRGRSARGLRKRIRDMRIGFRM